MLCLHWSIFGGEEVEKLLRELQQSEVLLAVTEVEWDTMINL